MLLWMHTQTSPVNVCNFSQALCDNRNTSEKSFKWHLLPSQSSSTFACNKYCTYTTNLIPAHQKTKGNYLLFKFFL